MYVANSIVEWMDYYYDDNILLSKLIMIIVDLYYPKL